MSKICYEFAIFTSIDDPRLPYSVRFSHQDTLEFDTEQGLLRYLGDQGYSLVLSIPLVGLNAGLSTLYFQRQQSLNKNDRTTSHFDLDDLGATRFTATD